MERRGEEDLYCQDPRHVHRPRQSHGPDHALSSQTRRTPTHRRIEGIDHTPSRHSQRIPSHRRIEGSCVTEIEDDDYCELTNDGRMEQYGMLDGSHRRRRSGRSRLQTQEAESFPYSDVLIIRLI
jgi:hypothetical protein